MTTRRVQHCPVDGWPLDDHTEHDMIECEAILTRETDLSPLTPVPPLNRVKIHPSWHWTLDERFLG